MPKSRRRRLAGAAPLLTAWLAAAAAPPPAAAPVTTAAPTAQVQDAERARAMDLQAQRAAAARAGAARADEQRLAAMRVAAAAKLREAETVTAAAADRVAALSAREQEARARLADRSADLTPLLPLIERLSLYPSETLLAVPLPPEQALRGVLVLGGVARELESQARAIRAEQATIAALQAQIASALPGFEAAERTQAAQASALDQQIAQTEASRHAAEDAAGDAARRAAAEAARADGLRAAIAKLEAERTAAETQARADVAAATRQRREADAVEALRREEALARPAGPGIGEAHAQLTAPVAGTVVRSFGEATDAGPATGLTYQAAPAARVVSPCTGKVVFAGPFRSYGQLIIVDCGGSTHFVLSGLERIDSSTGQGVQAGEPVGVMPAWDPRAGGSRPTLYVELRHDGLPVNPAPFLRGKG